METGLSQSSGGFTSSHCLPHRENLTRLIESGGGGEIGGLTSEEINISTVNPIYLTKRSKIVTKLPPIVKTSETPIPTLTPTNSMDNLLSNCKSFNSFIPSTSSASSSTSSSPSLASTSRTHDDNDNWKTCDSNCDTFDSVNNPTLKLRLIEKNLQFIKDQHKMVLNCLHNQVDDLSRKNRDLQFKLIVNNLLPDNLEGSASKLDFLISNASIKDPIPFEVINHITNLETEIKRLHLALGESLKMNASLRNRLMLKSTKSYQSLQSKEIDSQNCTQFKTPTSSSKVEAFRETWRAINSAKVESTKSFLPGIK